jgi:hypothetical protein
MNVVCVISFHLQNIFFKESVICSVKTDPVLLLCTVKHKPCNTMFKFIHKSFEIILNLFNYLVTQCFRVLI